MLNRFLLALSLIAVGSATAMAQERQWTLDVSDTDAYLVFGVPESDDVGVSFWCTLRTGTITLFVPETDAKLKAKRGVRFSLTAADKIFQLKGQTTANEEAASISIEAKLATADPVFASLRKADRFKLNVGGEEIIYPLVEADFAGLLESCRKP